MDAFPAQWAGTWNYPARAVPKEQPAKKQGKEFRWVAEGSKGAEVPWPQYATPEEEHQYLAVTGVVGVENGQHE
jgi:hypothetical protein